MNRLALLVGIDHYQNSILKGCINDANSVATVLGTNDDYSPNFDTRTLKSSESNKITRSILKENISKLFSSKAKMAVFYFAGHGTANNLGGYLVTQDAERYDEGVSMVDVLTMANQSNCDEIIILLDCCNSGSFGSIPIISNDKAYLREGISVLTASRSYEPALEYDGNGIFTTLLCEALNGGASNLLGLVSIADVYAFAERNLQPWDQRPLFKCHLTTLSYIRRCKPAIDISTLRMLPVYFPTSNYEYHLNPSFEPNFQGRKEENVKIFYILWTYRNVGLLEIEASHLWQAALNSRPCRLTKLGVYYWNLVKAQRI